MKMLRNFSLVFILIFCVSLKQAVEVSFNTITILSRILLFLCMTIIFVTLAKQNNWSQLHKIYYISQKLEMTSVAPEEGLSSSITPVVQGGEKASCLRLQ